MLGRGDFRKFFRILLGMIVSSWVIEIGWISMFSVLKREFSPWHKIQFSSELIYLGENKKAFDQNHWEKFLIQRKGNHSFWVIELSGFCIILWVKERNSTFSRFTSCCEHNLHQKWGIYTTMKII